MFDMDATAANIFPGRYRQVAVASIDVALDEEALREYFVGKEAYMRTRFIIVSHRQERALVEVVKEQDVAQQTSAADAPEEQLFSPIADLRVLAGPSECLFLELPETDVGVPAHMASAADEAGDARCVIVEGRYAHISFLLNPAPLRINVLDIVPPAPSKLLDQIRRVLDTAEDLPPIVLSNESIDSLDLLQEAVEADAAADPAAEPPAAVLLPCQGPGVQMAGVAVSYLDQRPERQDWVLLGCARSQQIHRWFYGSSAPDVDTCPRRFLGPTRDAAGATLTRCCLLQSDMEQAGRATLVPWGSSLAEVRAAIDALVEAEGFAWCPT